MIYLLIFSWLVISAVCLWTLIERRKNYLFLFVFIPCLLLNTVTTYFTISDLLGYPVEEMPGEFQYLSHHVYEPHWIYFWLIEKGSKEPRAFKIKYEKQAHKKANEAKQKRFKGIRMDGKFDRKMPRDRRGRFTSEGEFQFYQFDHQRHLPKETPKNELAL